MKEDERTYDVVRRCRYTSEHDTGEPPEHLLDRYISRYSTGIGKCTSAANARTSEYNSKRCPQRISRDQEAPLSDTNAKKTGCDWPHGSELAEEVKNRKGSKTQPSTYVIIIKNKYWFTETTKSNTNSYLVLTRTTRNHSRISNRHMVWGRASSVWPSPHLEGHATWSWWGAIADAASRERKHASDNQVTESSGWVSDSSSSPSVPRSRPSTLKASTLLPELLAREYRNEPRQDDSD